ncbi:MAG: TraR/DksA family transcriptional regulator [Candidatus Rariloculaceae bacterium]
MTDTELDLNFCRKKLLALREELEALQSTVDEAAETVELDQARVGRLSRMDALQSQSMSIEVKRRQELQLRGVASALARIDNDDYGLCAECGDSIHPERLSFDPTAILCIACAEAKED